MPSDMNHRHLRRGFKLMLARWRSQPIKYQVRERHPITERLQSISLKSRLSKVIELMADYQKRNYEELHAYVDSSQFDLDKASYEQIQEMDGRIKSAKAMLRLVFKKSALWIFRRSDW